MNDLEEAKRVFGEFCRTIAALRHPETGCPWDLKQTHESLRSYMIEEAYEAAAAMAGDDPREICDELGDVLLQVVLNAQLGRESGAFDITRVIDTINDKMIRRHPHVFGTAEQRKEREETAIKASWQAIKDAEKREVAGGDERTFKKAMTTRPGLSQALQIGKIARKIDFDWDTAAEVLGQLKSEVVELEEELNNDDPVAERLADEIGDVFFSLAQLCRHLQLDPETVTLDANRKFLRRFAAVERLADAADRSVADASRAELEALWQQVKRDE